MNNTRSIDNSQLVLITIVLFLILFAGFRPTGFDRDSLSYLENFNEVNSLIDSNYLNMEPTFWLIAYFVKSISDVTIRPLLLIYAALSVTINAYAIKKLTPYPLAALFIFAFLFYPLHGVTQIRVGVACAIFLLTIPDIVDRKLKFFLLKSVFATMFHYSAVVIFFTYFLKSKTINLRLYFALPIIGLILSFFRELLITTLNYITTVLPNVIGYKLRIYIALLEMDVGTEINLFSIYYSSLLIMYYFFICNINVFKSKYDIIFVKLLGWVLFIYYSMSFLPAIAVRISEIFSVIIIFLLPLLVHCFRDKQLASIILSAYVLIVFINNVFVHQLFNF